VTRQYIYRDGLTQCCPGTWRCLALYASRCVDDVMLAYNGPYGSVMLLQQQSMVCLWAGWSVFGQDYCIFMMNIHVKLCGRGVLLIDRSWSRWWMIVLVPITSRTRSRCRSGRVLPVWDWDCWGPRLYWVTSWQSHDRTPPSLDACVCVNTPLK